MDRRNFLRAAGGAAALGLGGGPGLARDLPGVGALHRLLEETPRERAPAELAGLIRGGLDRRPALAALAVAASRRVRPFPHVGFRYHSVLALQSAHLAALGLPGREGWLPLFWALDYFKRAQERERHAGGWTMGPGPAPAAATPAEARERLVDALDRWDVEAVDPAILDFARLAPPGELSEILFRYGIRDLRAIGHKTIAVQNVHRLLPIVGPAFAPPVLRSLAAALQNRGYDPNPATNDLPADRTWREFRTMPGEIPYAWKRGRRDDSARDGLVRALREVSEIDAGRAVIDLLKRGVSAHSIWEALFATAAELVLRRPRVVPVHAQTSANAFHYAFRHARDETTQLLALLQAAAFMPGFRRRVGDARPDLRIEDLEPLAVSGNGADALREAFAGLPGDPVSGARKALHYLRRGGSADALAAAARRHLAYVQGGAELGEIVAGRWITPARSPASSFSEDAVPPHPALSPAGRGESRRRNWTGRSDTKGALAPGREGNRWNTVLRDGRRPADRHPALAGAPQRDEPPDAGRPAGLRPPRGDRRRGERDRVHRPWRQVVQRGRQHSRARRATLVSARARARMDRRRDQRPLPRRRSRVRHGVHDPHRLRQRPARPAGDRAGPRDQRLYRRSRLDEQS